MDTKNGYKNINMDKQCGYEGINMENSKQQG
jgi:hypothetical protein